MADDRLAQIKARAAVAKGDPFFVTDCEGDLSVWRQSALTYITRDDQGNVVSWSEPSTYRVIDHVIDIDLETWDEGEDESDDQRRSDIKDLVQARDEDVPWLVDRLEQARGIAVELENETARLRSLLDAVRTVCGQVETEATRRQEPLPGWVVAVRKAAGGDLA